MSYIYIFLFIFFWMKKSLLILVLFTFDNGSTKQGWKVPLRLPAAVADRSSYPNSGRWFHHILKIGLLEEGWFQAKLLVKWWFVVCVFSVTEIVYFLMMVFSISLKVINWYKHTSLWTNCFFNRQALWVPSHSLSTLRFDGSKIPKIHTLRASIIPMIWIVFHQVSFPWGFCVPALSALPLEAAWCNHSHISVPPPRDLESPANR